MKPWYLVGYALGRERGVEWGYVDPIRQNQISELEPTILGLLCRCCVAAQPMMHNAYPVGAVAHLVE